MSVYYLFNLFVRQYFLLSIFIISLSDWSRNENVAANDHVLLLNDGRSTTNEDDHGKNDDDDDNDTDVDENNAYDNEEKGNVEAKQFPSTLIYCD